VQKEANLLAVLMAWKNASAQLNYIDSGTLLNREAFFSNKFPDGV